MFTPLSTIPGRGVPTVYSDMAAHICLPLFEATSLSRGRSRCLGRTYKSSRQWRPTRKKPHEGEELGRDGRRHETTGCSGCRRRHSGHPATPTPCSVQVLVQGHTDMGRQRIRPCSRLQRKSKGGCFGRKCLPRPTSCGDTRGLSLCRTHHYWCAESG